MTTDSNVLIPVVSLTGMRDSASTGMVIHVPENAGTSTFNMSMFNQFIDILQSTNSTKR